MTEDEPPLDVDPVVPPEERGRTLRLAGWLAAVTLAGVVAAWTIWATGSPTEADLREEARLVGKQELLIGVKDDSPGVALLDPKTGRYEGFDIEIAYMVAAELGFSPRQVRFLAIETEDRGRMQAMDRDGRFATVDLVVATFSVTAERTAQIYMSEPYLETEQTVVTRRDHEDVSSLGDLAGEKACTLATSTSEGKLREARATPVSKNRISECVAGLRAGKYDAVTTDAAILAGFVAKYANELRAHDIGLTTPERWGIATGRNRALRTLVNLALYRSYANPQDRRWEKAFDTYLAPLQQANGRQQVAMAEQPLIDEPDVRRWPWERDVP
ncbi:transporter substrate-binding domain-containing protein [Sphaerimonospora thailandensis]|uniref:transporter substrate-binding domain-containing protein n=1 Tax=Sphaerimonospora thailandensis TaxID=795644 RepID=UPI001952601B|nr:transporter substrate-binding domain-containing protein [Sphaerimonospora thailandensis]